VGIFLPRILSFLFPNQVLMVELVPINLNLSNIFFIEDYCLSDGNFEVDIVGLSD
jgi:hypothetical protein